ncbi:MAG: asparagine synthase (glutamine-hydrolyzing), partial [Cytophagales bacterium]|nr:asparagine synthase (glutamine-hydrolyzing) [Cytophaga sp.]
MCGINIIIDKRAAINADAIQAMNSATFYRGPDYSDFRSFQFKQQQIFIGINQLKIIDIDNAANQPFFSPDKRYFVLFNGTIYNYKELAAKLSPKYTFNTHSDTEILLY